MRLSVFEQRLEKQIFDSLSGTTPGVVIQVHQNGRKVCDIAVGETYPYYDLASLTKIIFTTQAMMKSFEEGKWNLKTKISEVVGWFPHTEVTVIECLNHSSGLLWWSPFYQNIDMTQPRLNRWTELARTIRELPLVKKDKSVYSDVGFLVLGFFLENLYSLPLIEIWQRLKSEFYSGTNFDFHVDNQKIENVKHYAPTENGGWRGKLIQGEVHDDNTWALGGVAPHAGLFGSIDDLGWYALMIRAQLQGVARNSIKSKTARLFATRSRPPEGGDFALGFMMKSEKGSMLGELFSMHSIGHWGFTGTSMWYDPQKDLSVCILSNRTLLGREIKEFNLLRPKIHDWVIEGLRRS